MTEILIVIGLIVLLLALAMPAFSFITGGRSIDGAQNQLAAFLGRARTEAIGLQQIRGVMFFIDPATPDRVSCALVQETSLRTGINGTVNKPDRSAAGNTDPDVVDVFLDLVPDTDFLQLPAGVGLQVIDNVDPTIPRDLDAYIGYNTDNAYAARNGGTNKTTDVRYGGVILFDGAGKLANRRYAFRVRGPAPDPTVDRTDVYTAMAALLFKNTSGVKQGVACQSDNELDVIPLIVPAAGATPPLYMQSQFGLVLYDLPQFQNKGFSFDDPQITGTQFTTGGENGEENWIESNSTAVLINRYNGTLVRNE